MSKRVSIVTGGSSGLGLQIAVQLAELGQNVCLVARDKAKLMEAAASVNRQVASDCSVITWEGDISNEDVVIRMYEDLDHQQMTVERLFNVAGWACFSDPTDVSRQRIDQVFAGNLIGLILMTSHALRAMETNGGTIVNVMSTAALLGRAKESVYCAAKWGARGFTEAIKASTKGSNVRVIAVYPGGMNTPFWRPDSGITPDVSKFMDPADVAKQIVHLATTIDSSWVTDVTINRAN